jgi:alpha-amylase/alpha-mannosidase (GH57 family)
MRHVCIHGHFYQPPRENPWLERIELQESAAPYHDWNERITKECYGVNTAARILDRDGFIVRIVSNYARISFNFGPTLLAWMLDEHPDTHAAIVAADEQSREHFGGHGSAIAQAYNHLILPLANRRDKITQITWGRRDFEQRFGRSPEGMWLPETAVDLESLAILTDQGMRYTILAPRQARRVRKIGSSRWQELEGESSLDTTMPYRLTLPSGGSLAIFFYNGPISRAVAFEGLLHSGARFSERILQAFPDSSDHDPLLHIATDGESYGHHHTYGDMALAYTLDAIESSGEARLTNYGEFLQLHPPTHEVEIEELTSWSCAHGVERWRADCGCRINPMSGWSQDWRKPLRESLDWLRDKLSGIFEEIGGNLLRDPWEARDAYIDIVLQRSEERQLEFIARHGARQLDEDEVVTSLQLLEMQRFAMLMFTSCGWFFDDLAGIEAVQILQYAARALQLAENLSGESIEAPFLEILRRARSNDPKHGDGAQVYDRLVRPSVVDSSRVAAHYAMSSLFGDGPNDASLSSYRISSEAAEIRRSSNDSLAMGRLRIRSDATLDTRERAYIVVHQGGGDLLCGIYPVAEAERDAGLTEDLQAAFRRDDIPRLVELIEQHPDVRSYSFESLFRDEKEWILESVVGTARQEAETAARHLFHKHLSSIRLLDDPGHPLSRALQVAAELTINADLRAALAPDQLDSEQAMRCLEDALSWEVALDAQVIPREIERAAAAVAQSLADDARDEETLRLLRQLVEAGNRLTPPVSFWDLQNTYYRWLQGLLADRFNELSERGAPAAWAVEFRALGEALRIRVPS